MIGFGLSSLDSIEFVHRKVKLIGLILNFLTFAPNLKGCPELVGTEIIPFLRFQAKRNLIRLVPA
jgi:hypothetical protein